MMQVEVDTGVGAGESALSAYGLFVRKGTFDQIEKLVIQRYLLISLLQCSPLNQRESSIQQAVEIDRGEWRLNQGPCLQMMALRRKLTVATYELSSEAIQIRGAVIDAIGSDKAIKLSDLDVNKIANLLERKFVSAASPRGEVAVKTQPPVEVASAAQMMGTNSFWALNENGDLTTSKVQRDAEYRLGVSAAATGTPDRPRQIELDSSMIAAQKPVGPNPKVPSSAQGKFEILDVEAQTREKTFTSVTR